MIVDASGKLLENESLQEVKGLAWLDGNTLVRNGKGDTIELDAFNPFAPQYRKFGPIEITRGCIYACRFCQTPHVNKARFRHRSLENIRQLVTLMHQYGLRDYRFLTPTSLSYGSDDTCGGVFTLYP